MSEEKKKKKDDDVVPPTKSTLGNALASTYQGQFAEFLEALRLFREPTVGTSLGALASSLAAKSSLHELSALAARYTPGVTRDAELSDEITALEKERADAFVALAGKDLDLKTAHREIDRLTKANRNLEQRERLKHLLTRLGPEGGAQVRTDEAFRLQFSADAPTRAFVLAIDLRRSTELMLKAREPRLYAQFLLDLVKRLHRVITGNYGVFDKFTGDGVVAFFPEFYTGQDAGLWAAKAALSAHQIFDAHYREHRRTFSVVLNEVGFGIGLDFGSLHIVEIGSEITGVGNPVVYACRLAGAAARTTLVNQPAFERLGEHCTLRETELTVKHDGRMLAYALEGDPRQMTPAVPPWVTAKAPVDAS
jgi:class 3 adenylate cyclase